LSESNPDVGEFVAQVTPATRTRDAETLIELMSRVTGQPNLDDIDLAVVESIIDESYRTTTAGVYGHRASESSGGRPTA
jgi:hypothetical protein